MEKRNIIIGGIVAGLIIIVAGALFFFNGGERGGGDQVVSNADPINIVLDFYDPWLAARKSTSTDPYKEELAKAPILSKELRAHLVSSKKRAEDEVDPVLCRMNVPEQISARLSFETAEKSQVLITSTDKDMSEQSIFTLLRHNEGWYIDRIDCSLGEFAPDREFSFEHEGFLLKTSVVPPLDPMNWHIVFEENGEQGHVAPLIFDEGSMCTTASGDTAVCTPDELNEAKKVFIQGQATEAGIQVKRMEFKE